MIKYIFIWTVLFLYSGPLWSTPVVSAFVRVKNEINTLPACLDSIQGLFDKIVIIYVDEPDDGSVEYIKQWCTSDKKCIHKAYPYEVYPSYDARYTGVYDDKHSLASYYNFGLNFFHPEEWILKIDADQIYIRPRLQEFLQHIKSSAHDDGIFPMIGYNTFERQNQLVYLKDNHFNGGKDCFAIKRKYISFYKQKALWEVAVLKSKNVQKTSPPLWFHFMKSLRFSNAGVLNRQTYPEHLVEPVSNAEAKVFEQCIRPLLHDNSLYKNIQLNP